MGRDGAVGEPCCPSPKPPLAITEPHTLQKGDIVPGLRIKRPARSHLWALPPV